MAANNKCRGCVARKLTEKTTMMLLFKLGHLIGRLGQALDEAREAHRLARIRHPHVTDEGAFFLASVIRERLTWRSLLLRMSIAAYRVASSACSRLYRVSAAMMRSYP